MNKLSLSLMLLCISSLLTAQTWVELMQSDDRNFYEIQEAFNNAFREIPPSDRKGTGWKQFKRWEYYHRQRVDAQGNFPEAGHLLREMENYYSTHPQLKTYASGSGNWSTLGPTQLPINITTQPNGNGRLTCITFHPTNPSIIYVGAPSGGFWKTTDGGATWTQHVTGLTRLGVSSIVINPSNPDIIYIGTGDRDGGDAPGYGVWRSTDGGLTWAAHHNGMGNRTVYEILMNPNNPDHLVASTSGQRIYKTTDGGANWTHTNLSSNMQDIAFKPGSPSTIYASGTTFEVSTDGGTSFTQISAGVPSGSSRMALAVSAADPNRIYLLAGGSSGLIGLYQSTNSGLSFSTMSTSPNILGYLEDGTDNKGQAWYNLVLVADPTNADIIYAGGINIWKSVNAGSSWSIVTHWIGDGGVADVHADQHVLEFSPHNPNLLYNGNDGGIYFTPDGGTNWTDITSGLAIAQIYKIGVAQTTSEMVISGYQDNGTGIYLAGENYTVVGGDGMECIIDPTDDSYVYAALYYGDIRRSKSGGNFFFTIAENGSNGITESGNWVTPYKLDPSDPARMFIGYVNIWRSDDVKSPAYSNVVWNKISSFSGGGEIADLAIAPSSNEVMYVSRYENGNRLLRTTNLTSASPTWTNLDANLPSSITPKDIEIDPSDPNHLFIALGNRIYESTDAGLHWSNFSGTLPYISVNTIVIDPESPVKAIYVGLDVGVYYRDNTMTDWVMFSTGLPNVEIKELEIHADATNCNSKIFAATYGQGLWVGDLKDPGNIAPTACFESSHTEACAGQPISLTSSTAYTPTSWTWTISPATFNFINGTHANSENPQVEFTASGTYTVSLSASNGKGTDVESKADYITIRAAANANTFNDDFESYIVCGTPSSCHADCAIVGKWTNLTNGVDDAIDFHINTGGTPSSNTGPSTDFNPGTATGKYAYIEAAYRCSQDGILESSCITLDKDYDFSLAYHMQGSQMGSLHIDLNSGSGWVEDIVTPISGDQGSAWKQMTVDLSPYTGQTINIRIRAIIGRGSESDIAIDDILFQPQTVFATNIISVKAACKAEGRVEINWITEDNDMNELFEIQKTTSINQNWETIGTVPVSNKTKYQFFDMNPLVGDNYYRIAAVNPSGKINYSKIINTSCHVKRHAVVVFPNPFKDQITIQVQSEYKVRFPYRLTNLLGQTLKTGSLDLELGLNNYPISLADLPRGVYLLRIDNMKDTAFKIVKQ